MVKMTNGGITIEVVENEVDFYKRAGYVVGVPVAPVEEVPPAAPVEPEPAPAEKAPVKKK